MKYIKIQNNNIEILETDNFSNVIKNEFNDTNYDSLDYLFDENLDIRIFTKAGSDFLDLDNSLYYKRDGKLQYIFKGTILLAKNGINKWHSLSNKDIKIITNRILKIDNSFVINY